MLLQPSWVLVEASQSSRVMSMHWKKTVRLIIIYFGSLKVFRQMPRYNHCECREGAQTVPTFITKQRVKTEAQLRILLHQQNVVTPAPPSEEVQPHCLPIL